MSYELAKELKDAGFPQEERGNILLHVLADPRRGITDHWKPIYTKNTKENGLPNTEWLFVPTLSELIEACGEFSSLTKSPRGTWYCARSEGSVEMVVGDEYSTPEEAVARLWLALNKKP